MSRLLILLLAFSSTAYAQCYTRSSTLSESKRVIERITDVERSILPKKNGVMCRVTFRAYMDGSWHTVEGEAEGARDSSLDQLCAQATDVGRARVIEKVSGRNLTNTQEMICTDEELPSLQARNAVRIGEIVRDSQVQPHPLYRDVFQFRGAQCRWFVESVPRPGQVEMSQGVICKSPDEKAWMVVDKW